MFIIQTPSFVRSLQFGLTSTFSPLNLYPTRSELLLKSASQSFLSDGKLPHSSSSESQSEPQGPKSILYVGEEDDDPNERTEKIALLSRFPTFQLTPPFKLDLPNDTSKKNPHTSTLVALPKVHTTTPAPPTSAPKSSINRTAAPGTGIQAILQWCIFPADSGSATPSTPVICPPQISSIALGTRTVCEPVEKAILGLRCPECREVVITGNPLTHCSQTSKHRIGEGLLFCCSTLHFDPYMQFQFVCKKQMLRISVYKLQNSSSNRIALHSSHVSPSLFPKNIR